MKIPGIDTILYRRAHDVWSGEDRPPDALVRLLEEVPYKIELGRFDDADAMLQQIATFDLQLSQVMRMRFLMGQLASDRKVRLYDQAYQHYHEALRIAEERGDLDSRITLVDHTGRMKYGLLKNQDALDDYKQALALWRVRAEQIAKPRAEPEVRYLERIGTLQWCLGSFDDAQATLARTLTLALRAPRIRLTDYMRRTTAGALWSLALALRSQSDMSEGSMNTLETALKRMTKAVEFFKFASTSDAETGRLHVQIAELYLDRAEILLLNGDDDPECLWLRHASKHIKRAAEFLIPADDEYGALLVDLTRLRRLITRRRDGRSAWDTRKFQAELQRIRAAGERLEDGFILAKAATLQGEWLLWQGDVASARLALRDAFVHFQDEGMGMATRAQRLLRRANSAMPQFAPRRTHPKPAAPPPNDTQP